MQAAVATELLVSGLAIVIVPTILIVLMPIIDNVLSEQVIENINSAIDNIEFFLGSTNTNLLFAVIWLIIVTIPIRYLFRFFKN